MLADTVKLAEENLRIRQSQFEHGLVRPIDVAQSERELSETQAQCLEAGLDGELRALPAGACRGALAGGGTAGRRDEGEPRGGAAMRGAWFRILLLLLLVIGLAVGGGWWMIRSQLGTEKVPVTAPSAPPRAAVEKTTSVTFATKDTITLPGVIEPYESLPVSAKLTASIASLPVREGSTVRKGQVLCILDDGDLRREIDQQRVALMQARELLHRDTETRGVEKERKQLALITAQKDLEGFQAEADLQLEEAKTELTRAERELAETEELYKAKAVAGDEVRARQELGGGCAPSRSAAAAIRRYGARRAVERR